MRWWLIVVLPMCLGFDVRPSSDAQTELGVLSCTLAKAIDTAGSDQKGAASEAREMVCFFQPGTNGPQEAYIGTVRSISVKTTKYKKVRLTEATVHDDSGHAMRIAWFNNPYVTRNLHRGDRVAFAGALKRGWGGVPEMQNPHYEKLEDREEVKPTRVGGLMPKYHLDKLAAQLRPEEVKSRARTG